MITAASLTKVIGSRRGVDEALAVCGQLDLQ